MSDVGDGQEGRAVRREAPERPLLRLARRLPVVRRMASSRVGPLEEALVAARAEVHQLQLDLAAARGDLKETQDAHARTASALADIHASLTALTHNHELLKGELWDTRVELSSGRVVEVRERLAAVDRRLRRVEGARGAAAPGQGPVQEPANASPAVAEISSTLFDYVGFERRFRGDPSVINTVLHERYADLLRGHQPVVDIGCGRGELLEMLAREGVDVVGVEPDPGMADEARARGIEVHQVVASAYLDAVPDGSLGSIISTHVVEHLPLDVLVGFLEQSARKLRPGGVFVAETPNPATLVVLASHFIMDPTHEWPLHPELMSFLCESAGFRDVHVEFFSPATTLQLPLGDGVEAADPALAERVDEGFRRLNQVLFGPQDYAVIATVGVGVTSGDDGMADPS